MSMRLRRLMSDYEKIRSEFAGHRFITVTPVAGNPPERYRIVYRLTSLRWDEGLDRPVELGRHEVEIYLPQDYPRNTPQCLIHTPIFHPNFSANHSPNIVCIGDHWAAGNSLVDVIIKIGEMLQFRTYNVRSPLNAIAARWALENVRFFPIGKIDLYQPEPDVELGEAVPAAPEEEPEPTPVVVKPADPGLEIELTPGKPGEDLEISLK